MPHITVSALFDGEKLHLLEDPPVKEPYQVMVTFIKPEPKILTKEQLDRFRASFGAWKDKRSIKETITDIYESRTSKINPPTI
jgi:hypothetical protein